MSTPGEPVRALLEPVRRAIASMVAGQRERARSGGGGVIEEREVEVLLEELARRPAGGAAPDEQLLALARTSPLARAARAYGLGLPGCAVLLVAVAPELDGRIGRLFAYLNDRPGEPRATVGLLDAALEALGLGERAATRELTGSVLTSWGLVEVQDGAPWTWRAVVPARDVVQRLTGIEPLGDRIAAPSAGALAELTLRPELRARADELAARLVSAGPAQVLVLGPPGRGRTALARAILANAGIPSIAAAPGDAFDALARGAAWSGCGIVVEAGAAPPGWAAWAARCPTPCCVVAERPSEVAPEASGRARLEIDVGELGADERRRLWERRLPVARRGGLELAGVARRFRFGPGQIVAAAELALARGAATAGPLDERALLAACRDVSTPAFGELAQVLPPVADAGDLVLPTATRRELDLALAWAAHGDALHAAHPRAQLIPRGLVCLFHGQPGTGKTLAARVLAGQLGLRLVRIDLSQVVSKYIGETEKSLARLFEAAVADNAILFFDEADALFGRRTEVRDAHDRYANVETGYLLQRIEGHPGLAILATNLLANFDPAFMRRILVIAEFPMPGPEERLQIWARHLPPAHDADVDPAFLAQRFALAGGDIRNICVAAMIMAAADGRPLAMLHLIAALCRELGKLGRLVKASELGPWAAAAAAMMLPAAGGQAASSQPDGMRARRADSAEAGTAAPRRPT